MSDKADIVVIGGGIAGLSAAAKLAEQAKVTVVEAEAHTGFHSSGRSAAIFVLNYGNDTLRALNAISYPELSGGFVGQNVLSPRGEMLIAREQDVPQLEDYLAQTDGLEQLTADEAVELVPILRRDQVAMAAIEHEAQDIDIDLLMQGCIRLLRERGGRLITGARVTAIEAQGQGWRVQAGDYDLRAGVVVNAAGAWADHVAALAEVRAIGLQPTRRSAVIMPMPAELAQYRSWPMFASCVDEWYAKPEATGLMISPSDEDLIEAQDAWPDDMVLAEGLYRFEQMIDLPIVKPSHSWAGLRNFVADHTPVNGFDPDAPGFFWLAGQGGYGFQTAPAMAEICAAHCLGLDMAAPDTLVSALSPERLR